jgi:(p)ppGpp synthase/HD superfamily hydrolase
MSMTVAEDGGPATAREAALDESRDAHGREVKMPGANSDLGLVLRATQFAAQKHKDQRRKDVKATPYINHPINLAEVLHTDGGVHDPIVIAAALLHDTIEDTETTYDELRGAFGASVADVVIEVTDVKFLARDSRKRLQVAKAGRASERARGVNSRLERMFDRLYRQRPVS